MPHLVSITSLYKLKCCVETLQFHQFEIDMGWVSKPTGFCEKHVHDFLSSSVPTPPSLAVPWQQKASKIHRSALGSELFLPSGIILALVVLIP